MRKSWPIMREVIRVKGRERVKWIRSNKINKTKEVAENKIVEKQKNVRIRITI